MIIIIILLLLLLLRKDVREGSFTSIRLNQTRQYIGENKIEYRPTTTKI